MADSDELSIAIQPDEPEGGFDALGVDKDAVVVFSHLQKSVLRLAKPIFDGEEALPSFRSSYGLALHFCQLTARLG